VLRKKRQYFPAVLDGFYMGNTPIPQHEAGTEKNLFLIIHKEYRILILCRYHKYPHLSPVKPAEVQIMVIASSTGKYS
ncbi:MAG: hypothetical protein VB050_02305, partial [Geobacteraceae bacterium]|nr:hypothetical protein [Geobacteraceae bacterium]